MNIKNLEYFLEVARDCNMTAAAARLYISQQALSMQIQKLENYYGTTLFERHPRLRLTYAGEELVEGAERIVRENEYLLNHLSTADHAHHGTLKLGISSARARQCFPLIIPAYSEKWPNIKIQLVDESTPVLLGMLEEGKLDVVFTSTDRAGISSGKLGRITCLEVFKETNYLAISDTLMDKVFGSEAEVLKSDLKQGTDLSLFRSVPFILFKRPMKLRGLADECFLQAGFKPDIYIETDSFELVRSLYTSHVGAFFCRGTRLAELQSEYTDCNAFPLILRGEPVKTPVCLMYNHIHRPAAHVRDFMDMLQEAWEKLA